MEICTNFLDCCLIHTNVGLNYIHLHHLTLHGDEAPGVHADAAEWGGWGRGWRESPLTT